MFRRVLLKAVFFIALGYLASFCANISAPTGGPKDLVPPVVVKASPANSSVNFTGKSFTVTFDEYLVLDRMAEKFMVSPPFKKNPLISLQGKSLVVDFDETLKDSTTYTFYFQDAIRDLNESNPISNFQYVFSTGPVVDSLSVTGNIYSASDLEAGADYLVLLHRQLADSLPRTSLPDYITKADKNGSFRINNVSAGKYKLYALNDKNNNKRYDMKEEFFAFLDSAILVTVSKNYLPVVPEAVKPKTVTTTSTTPATAIVPAPVIGEYKLFSSPEPKKTQYITASARLQANSLIYTFAMPLDTATFDFSITGATSQSYYIEENIMRDTFKIWISDTSIYLSERIESIIKHPFTDSTGMLVSVTDTIPMRFLAPRPTRGTTSLNRFLYTFNIQSGTLNPNEKLVFKSQNPFREPDTSRIRLFETKDTIRQVVPFRMIRDTTNSCRYILDAGFKENSKYLLVVDSAALGDLYGAVSDSTGVKFSIRTKETFGSLTVNLSGYDKDLIIQLLDNSEKLISQVKRKGAGKVVFPLIEKGLYRLKVIYDLDGNGIWTTGDYDLLRQPEPVSYYPVELNVKVNWELQQDWNISVRNFKNQVLRKKAAGS